MRLSKKTVYDKLVAKVNHIDASEFVLKTKYDTDKSSLVNKKIDADRKYQILMDLLKKVSITTKMLLL